MTRVFDIFFSLVALLLFFPFCIVIMIILRFTGEGEILYTQSRVGKGGRYFGLLKFATMLKDSPSIGTGDITVKGDPRVLPVGNFLRKTKINEIPQLINILVGDMSFVGPRPQTPKNFEYFPPESRGVILSMRPGLTGIGSIIFRDEETITANSDKPIEECYSKIIGPYKATLEKWYCGRQTVLNYFLLIFVTVWVIFFPRSEIYRRVWPSLPELPSELNII